MKRQQILVGVVLGAALSAGQAMNIATSDFEAGADGWEAVNGARAFAWQSSGGDAGGFVRAKDLSSDMLWFFSAPAPYLGDVAAAYGGALSYALKSDSDSAPITAAYADVQLLGSNGVLLAFGGGASPAGSWTHYTVPLLADGAWRIGSIHGPAATASDLLAVLADLSALRIRGDYRQSVEVTGLDAVVLSAVPEPGQLALLLAGLAVVAGQVRRRGRALIH